MKESVDTYWHTSTDFHLLSSIVMNSDLLVNGLIQLSALHFLLIICKTRDLGDNLVRKIYTGVNMTGGYGGYYCTHFTPHYI